MEIRWKPKEIIIKEKAVIYELRFHYYYTFFANINGQENAVGQRYQILMLITGEQDRNHHIWTTKRWFYA